jgi:hypothetical protein
MRKWQISTEGPLSLCIAADARLATPNYFDDQSWELSLEGGDPPALALQTTYGLRARSMRIFPSFRWGPARVMDPKQFASPPIIQSILPNYLRLTFKPFAGLEVSAEYWVPESHIVAGRFTIRNLESHAREARLHLHAILRPDEGANAIGEVTIQGAYALSGRTASLTPVVFLSGGAVVEQAVYPAMSVRQELGAGESKSWIWAHAALSDQEDSFNAARSLTVSAWDSEIARIELVNNSLVDIETGDPAWDAVLAQAQKASIGCIVGPTRHLPHPSFVLNRSPDRGYSARGDGKDYDWQWDGQNAADAYLFLAQILPSAPGIAAGILRNFLAAQMPDGSIDWKPGLGGQRNGALSVPLLATLAWEIFLWNEERDFVQEVFKPVLEFFETWFTQKHDQDGDGFPEWDHTTHALLDNAPSFVRWHPWGQGLDISKVETPNLASFLFRECCSLIHMADLLEVKDVIPSLEAKREHLREAVEASWSEDTFSYHHVDRDQHCAVSGEVLGKGKGEFIVELDRLFDPPARVLVRSSGPEDQSHAIKVFIHGRGRRGRSRIEKLNERCFQWYWVFGTSTSDKTYAEIERIEVKGLSEAFETELYVADHTRQDLSLLLPLWAGIPTAERAEVMVRETLLDPDRYWRPHGAPNCSAQDPAYASDNRDGAGGVSMLWNMMMVEGLLAYGFFEEAVVLVAKLLETSLQSLRKEKAFREIYDADQPGGSGERDHLYGLFPVNLYLKTLGVRLISPRKVWLRGRNPFPRPVKVYWKGLTLVCLQEKTLVTFPDGQQLEVEAGQPQYIEEIPSSL